MTVSSTHNLWGNILRRLDDSAVYELLLEGTPKNMRLRSAYSRAISMIDCSIAEALIFYIIRQHSREEDPVIQEKEKNSWIAPVPPALGLTDDIFYAKKVKIPRRLSQSQFEPMIDYCHREGLLTESEYKKVDGLRIVRNKIHLHKVTSKDRGYTAAQLKKLSSVLNLLIDKL